MYSNVYNLHELSQKDIMDTIKLAKEIKENRSKYVTAVQGKTLAMLFESASLRTRASFEVAMIQMGGGSVYLKNPPQERFPDDKQDLARIISDLYLKNIASIKDELKVLSRYFEAVTWRTYSEEKMLAAIEHSDVPVINAMTPGFHPMQGLTDLLTMYEKKGKLDGLNLTLYGDLGRAAGTNVANDLFLGAAKMGVNITASVPEARAHMPTRGFSKKAWDWALEDGKESGATVKIEHDPFDAAKEADVIYSFYQGTQVGGKGANPPQLGYPEYQVRMAIVESAKPDVIVMHCMPATRDLEITGEVLDSKYAVLIDQAENRLHTAKAVLYNLMK